MFYEIKIKCEESSSKYEGRFFIKDISESNAIRKVKALLELDHVDSSWSCFVKELSYAEYIRLMSKSYIKAEQNSIELANLRGESRLITDCDQNISWDKMVEKIKKDDEYTRRNIYQKYSDATKIYDRLPKTVSPQLVDLSSNYWWQN